MTQRLKIDTKGKWNGEDEKQKSRKADEIEEKDANITEPSVKAGRRESLR